VAKHFGAHASFVSKVESGERRLDVVELADFCRLYGVRLAAFLKKSRDRMKAASGRLHRTATWLDQPTKECYLAAKEFAGIASTYNFAKQ
jgi:hypothetical protein